MASKDLKIVALAGGVGGAKLVHGLAQSMPPENLTVIVNTADDFEHYGLYICPDLDTVCYTLAGLANITTGWGRVDETWQAIENAVRLGGPGWFNLGDRDLGTHLERTRRLKEGQALSQITRDFCKAWGIRPSVLPMSDYAVRTIVETGDGESGLPGVFRPSQVRAEGNWLSLRRRRDSGSSSGRARGDKGCRRGDHLPVQSVGEHRSHSGGRGPPASNRRKTSLRNIAYHRR
jgi:2-phospho-L-lactate transferase/gluconeogenesis factor (CofD/UPF0052 family)